MSLLKHWQERKAVAVEQAEGEDYGPGRPSPDTAARPLEDRRNEALELLGELTDFYNQRASILEFEGHFPREEAERLALAETKATETYRRWRALG
jgi:hypothetical protein